MSGFFKMLLMIYVQFCLSRCDDSGAQRGNQGIKSYGGVFQDSNTGQNAGVQHAYPQLNQQAPVSYRPVGWNLNNQPQRTYGKKYFFNQLAGEL